MKEILVNPNVIIQAFDSLSNHRREMMEKISQANYNGIDSKVIQDCLAQTNNVYGCLLEQIATLRANPNWCE